VLHNFGGTPPKGANPSAGVVMDSAGNFYGTGVHGGAFAHGVVFKLDTTGHETVLHGFAGGDGANPYAGVVFDADGNLYGTTLNGGASGLGVVYKLDPTGVETVLHAFAGGADGQSPWAGIVLDSAGNLYGTTNNGGVADVGTVYKVDPTGNETVLYSFTGKADGGFPMAGVILDPAGNLYGANNGGADEEGVIYKLDASGNFTLLFTFNYTDGAYPNTLIRDSAGNLFGSAASGTSSEAGLVYVLDPAGKQTILHQFVERTNGSNPSGPLIRDSYGDLYGTASVGGTEEGGPGFGYLGGVVFAIKMN